MKEKRLIQYISILINISLDKLQLKKFLPNRLLMNIENIICFIRRKKVRFKFLPEESLFFAKEGNEEKYFINLARGCWLYRDGIETRGEFIFNSYCLHHINFAESDIVIDCGANAGDLSITLNKIISKNNYFAVEPNPEDFKILKLNVKSENIFNFAFGENNETKEFWISTKDADSSLMKPEKYEGSIDVVVKRLDSFIREQKIQKIKLLKLEAEGYEPEVLSGLVDELHRFEYIAIDGGYERNKEQTFSDISNFLISRNFEMVDIFQPWLRCLFKNTKINSCGKNKQ